VEGHANSQLPGRLYLQSSCVFWAAMICHLPFRLSQVSVQIKHRAFSVPSFAFRTEPSLPYAIARSSPKKTDLGIDQPAVASGLG
jgi:hypothetical protein